MSATTVVGWDIGGAHLKVAQADPGGRIVHVRQLACPLWRGLPVLRDALRALPEACAAAVHAVTMTGELCDVFPTREAGVEALLALLAEAVGPRRLRIYGGPAGWLERAQAAAQPAAVASMNWHATAAVLARAGGPALLADVGSTTTDLVPVAAGRVRAAGATDAERLACDELVYQGVVRTPVMAVCRQAPYAGRWQTLAAEHFASMADVYRLTGELPADADLMDTADGRPKDRANSAARLARMLGREGAREPSLRLEGFARFVAHCQLDGLQRAMASVVAGLEPPILLQRIAGAGCGRFVARRLAVLNGLEYVDFADLVPSLPALAGAVADCAPAAALAHLAALDGP